MEMLDTLFGGEMSTAVQLILITIALVVGLLVIFWLFRKFKGSAKFTGSRKRQPRLGVTDAAYVDDKRRLILVRRDNVEHLVLIGGPTDLVVESNVQRPRSAATTPNQGQVSPDPLPDSKVMPDGQNTAEEAAQTSSTPTPQAIAAAAVGAATAIPPLLNSTEPAPSASVIEPAPKTQAAIALEPADDSDLDNEVIQTTAEDTGLNSRSYSQRDVQPPEPVAVEPVRAVVENTAQISTRNAQVENGNPPATVEPRVAAVDDLQPIASPIEEAPVISVSNNEPQLTDDTYEAQGDEISHTRSAELEASENVIEKSEIIAASTDVSGVSVASDLASRRVETVESVSLDPAMEDSEQPVTELAEPILPEPVLPDKPAVTTDEIRVAAASVTEKIDEIISHSGNSDPQVQSNGEFRAAIEDDIAASIDDTSNPVRSSDLSANPTLSNGIDAPPIAPASDAGEPAITGRPEDSEDEMKRLLKELSGEKIT